MKRTVTVFQLARMRHLDLLAIWHRLNPGAHEYDRQAIARRSKDQIATEIIRAQRPHT